MKIEDDPKYQPRGAGGHSLTACNPALTVKAHMVTRERQKGQRVLGRGNPKVIWALRTTLVEYFLLNQSNPSMRNMESPAKSKMANSGRNLDNGVWKEV